MDWNCASQFGVTQTGIRVLCLQVSSCTVLFRLRAFVSKGFFDGTFSVKKLPIKFYLQTALCAALWGSAFPVIKLSYAHLGLETYGEKLLFAGDTVYACGYDGDAFLPSKCLEKLRRRS